ncbi:MAG: DUF922 domain-containing protein [Bacteroidetes bacterium]|jgi:hypothetical protein|nr:MAG: DUF922 domain-containing protein [Bacteroidota bacterium]
MRICPAYTLAILLMPSMAFAQAKDEETIDWHSSRQLSWNDYKGRPDPNSDAAASTTTYLGIEYKMDDKSFNWKIQCRFSLTKSWGRTKTDIILRHEQGHFDIAEIFARKLHKRMKEYHFNQATYETDLREIYSSITAEKEAFQDLYDNETDHSRKKDVQEKWLKKIATTLEELKGFANYS